jgi:hypothetical protein
MIALSKWIWIVSKVVIIVVILVVSLFKTEEKGLSVEVTKD